jgi:hypothetical protein
MQNCTIYTRPCGSSKVRSTAQRRPSISHVPRKEGDRGAFGVTLNRVLKGFHAATEIGDVDLNKATSDGYLAFIRCRVGSSLVNSTHTAPRCLTGFPYLPIRFTQPSPQVPNVPRIYA